MHHHLQEKLSWKLPMTEIGAATDSLQWPRRSHSCCLTHWHRGVIDYIVQRCKPPAGISGAVKGSTIARDAMSGWAFGCHKTTAPFLA